MRRVNESAGEFRIEKKAPSARFGGRSNSRLPPSARLAGSGVLLDKQIDVARQYQHRHIATLHDRIVEQSQVKLASQLSPGLGSQAVDFAVSDFITTCLARP